MREGEQLFTWQLGPVQDFIAQARSTRDLWAGSYLLSWLSAHALVAAEAGGARLVLPATDGQPLVEAARKRSIPGENALLPSLPNRFVAVLPAGAEAPAVAAACTAAVREELSAAGDAAWKAFLQYGGRPDADTGPWKTRWDAQLRMLPAITWHAIPVTAGTSDWSAAYGLLTAEHAARRNTREFTVFTTDPGQCGSPKDALSGREESIGDKVFWAGLKKSRLFRRNEPLGAPNLLKRFLAKAHLRGLWAGSAEGFWAAVGFDSTRDVAEGNRGARPDDAEDESSLPNGYIAVIAADGDGMGRFFSGADSEEELARRSTRLGRFATHAAKLASETAQLVYAGGDDVLAMCPSDQAVDLARKVRDAFRQELAQADLSCGIAVAHYMHPLQDMVHAAHAALARAKTDRGRSACELTLLKRGGETVHWGAKWNSAAWKLYRDFSERGFGKDRDYTGRFASNLAQLLAPYRLKQDRAPAGFEEIVRCEFEHVQKRQAAQRGVKPLSGASEYLAELAAAGGGGLADFPQLFLSAAFLNRARKGADE